ncbi:MAG: hypothetical protein CMJ25_29150 [Phycisphaerae bacterium]|nr:hypothetical protein [Phycisphaerae bacterium]|tara:strand:- start:3617 stop:5104 length:1488 start_codon:yes stop_codon:yes gene_type:complete
MAGEGLFFTGQVLKNNRNLLQEQAVREQLSMRKEQLDFQKGQLADQRAEARRKGMQPKTTEVSYENLDPFFVDILTQQVDGVTKFATDNSQDIYSGEDKGVSLAYQKMSNQVDANQSKYSSLSSDLRALYELSASENSGTLKVNEDGIPQYQVNYDKIKEEVGNNNMTLDDALKMYPIDISSSLKQENFVNPADGIFRDLVDDEVRRNVSTSSDGSYETTTLLTESSINEGIRNLERGFTPNKSGGFDGYEYGLIVAGEPILFYEYKDDGSPKDGTGSLQDARDVFALKELNASPTEDFYNSIDPKSESFNPTKFDEFKAFLVDETVKAQKSLYKPVVERIAADKVDEEGLTQEDVNLLTAPSTEIESFGGVQVKADPSFIDDVVGNKLTVGLKPEYLIEGQGELQSTFEALYKEAIKGSNKPVTGNVTRVGLTTGNVPVAAVSFGTVEVLIPISRLSSVSEKLKENAKAYKIYQIGESQGLSSQGVGSKYNKST